MSGAVAFGLLGHVYDDEVDAASQQAQAAIDQVLLHPLIRRPSTLTEEFVSRLRLTEAHASAALAGAEIPFAAFASSLMGDSPLSIRLRAAVSVEQASRESADVLSMSPPRALGAWHVRASAGAGLPEELRGRPVTSAQGSVVRDELNTGLVRLLVEDCVPAITGVVTNPQIPAVTAAGTVHALLAAGLPFASDNALLGRAAVRALLVARGSDPDGLLPFNAVLFADGRPALVRQLRSAITDGVVTRDWLLWHASLLSRAAQRALAEADRIRAR